MSKAKSHEKREIRRRNRKNREIESEIDARLMASKQQEIQKISRFVLFCLLLLLCPAGLGRGAWEKSRRYILEMLLNDHFKVASWLRVQPMTHASIRRFRCHASEMHRRATTANSLSSYFSAAFNCDFRIKYTSSMKIPLVWDFSGDHSSISQTNGCAGR